MDIRDLLFWFFLILGVILLVWNVFGDSPTEFIGLVALIFTVLLKVWKISERQIITEIKVKEGFIKIRADINMIKKKLKI